MTALLRIIQLLDPTEWVKEVTRFWVVFYQIISDQDIQISGKLPVSFVRQTELNFGSFLFDKTFHF